MKTYDSIIVGGGPAGASAAYEMARGGLEVLVLEKARMPRYKCCGGGIPRKVAGFLEFDVPPCCEKEVRGAVFSWLSEESRRLESDELLGWVVRRETFDDHLLRRAREAGAKVEEGKEVIGLEENSFGVIARTRGEEFSARTLVGADGAGSPTARRLGIRKPRSLGFALEARVFVPEEVLNERGGLLYFDMGAVSGGYGWVFPRRDHLSVGLAARRPRLKDWRVRLEGYLERENLAGKYSRVEVRGGMLSFGIPAASLVKGNCLLAGGAAGLTDRLTGEGIYQALLSGRLAARAIRNFLDGKRELGEYRSDIRRELGGNLRWGSILSRVQDAVPRLIFNRVVSNRRRAWKWIRIATGEVDYREIFFR